MQGFTGLGPEILGFMSFNGVVQCQLHSRNAVILSDRMLSKAKNFAGDEIWVFLLGQPDETGLSSK